MIIVWAFICIVSLVSALIIQQEFSAEYHYWFRGGKRFFDNLSCFGPQQNDGRKYQSTPQWNFKIGGTEIEVVCLPGSNMRDSIGENYNPLIFKFGQFYIVIWSN